MVLYGELGSLTQIDHVFVSLSVMIENPLMDSTNEIPQRNLRSQENGGQNSQEAMSMMQKSPRSREWENWPGLFDQL